MMKKENQVIGISVEELLFYIYFFLMLFTKGIGLVDGPLYKGLVILASAVILVKIGIGEYTRREKILIAGLLVLTGIILVYAGNQGVLFCVLLVLGMKNVRLERAFTAGVWMWGLTFFLQWAVFLSGYGRQDHVIHSKLGFDHVIRWAFGYSHPNVLQISYCALVMYLFYIVRTDVKRNRWMIAAAVAGALYIFMYSLSSTGMLMFLCFMIFYAYFEGNRHFGRRESRLENVLLQMIFPAAALISVAGPVLIKGRAFDLINRLLTTRPALTRYFLTTYGLNLFGEDFAGIDFHLTLDCSYANLLMNGGLVIFLVMMAGYFLTIRSGLKQPVSYERSVRLAILFSIVLTAMSEPFAFNTSYKNVSLLLVGSWLFGGESLRSGWFTIPGSLSADVSANAAFAAAASAAVASADKRTVFGNISRRISGFAAHEVSVPDLRYYLHLMAGWLRGGVRGAQDIRKQRRKTILFSVTSGLVFAIICFALYPMPSQVYARRYSCDKVDDYSEIYISEETARTMKNDPDIMMLGYADEKTPMVRFIEEDIVPVERTRAAVSAGMIGGTAVLLILTARCNRKQKRQDR
ncbi:MAG: hypothetical protein IJV14_08145 [Lachnospiraceae bacterium]|nr:hypothetical protein [Lachnospiraceae bacterium]